MPTSVASSSSSSAAPEPVIRHGFVIPSIRLTPPDSRPAKSTSVPEQDLGKYSLYVPLRTEEIGWEEGGIVWANVYAYPTVNLVSAAPLTHPIMRHTDAYMLPLCRLTVRRRR